MLAQLGPQGGDDAAEDEGEDGGHGLEGCRADLHAEEVQVDVLLGVDGENGGGLGPHEGGQAGAGVERHERLDAQALGMRGLLALDDVHEVHDGDEDRRSGQRISELRDRHDAVEEQEGEQRDGEHDGAHDEAHGLDPAVGRQRIVRLEADGAEELLLGQDIADGTHDGGGSAQREGGVVASDQRDSASDGGNSGADLGDGVRDGERAVAAGVAVLVHLARERLKRAAGQHGREDQHHLAGGVARDARAGDCEHDVGHGHEAAREAQAATGTENVVGNIGADEAGQDGDRRVQRDQLSGIGLREAQAVLSLFPTMKSSLLG